MVKILDVSLPLLTLPYIARILTKESFGVLIICIGAYGIANIITDFGFTQSGPYIIAKRKNKYTSINNYLSAVFFIKLILSIVSICIITFYLKYYLPSDDVNYYTLILISLIIFNASVQIHWYFLGIEKMKNITLLASSGKLSYLVLIFMIVPFSKSMNSVLLCVALSHIIITILYFILLKKENIVLSPPRLRYVKFIFLESVSFFISKISMSASTDRKSVV